MYTFAFQIKSHVNFTCKFTGVNRCARDYYFDKFVARYYGNNGLARLYT